MSASSIPEDLVNLYQRFGGEAVNYHEFKSRPETGIRWLPFEQLQPKPAEPESVVVPVNDAVVVPITSAVKPEGVSVAVAQPSVVASPAPNAVSAPTVVTPPAVMSASTVAPVIAAVTPVSQSNGSLRGLFARLEQEQPVVATSSLRSVLNKLSQ